jgi:hypothetical protein
MVSNRVVQRGRQHPPKKVEKPPLIFQGQADKGRCAASSIRLLCLAAVVIGEKSREYGRFRTAN